MTQFNEFVAKLINKTIHNKITWNELTYVPNEIVEMVSEKSNKSLVFNLQTKTSNENILGFFTANNNISIYIFKDAPNLLFLTDGKYKNIKSIAIDSNLMLKLYKTIETLYNKDQATLNNMINSFFND
ncbi:hypothetical protein HMPREF1983_01030 [Gemella bergeri ATCC 700627]|uniref:Uncharacterized protein n=1 Tax=Gemella bergeri ATCC 700627 TaxID=1321820 RepID=U2Q4K1_9BACL|nr:hypothetical protein [Gemella bergeri]ERK57705.1 hypothetical protein HMPREF1983_01030 [Gemella bergeri ATCC 700627]